MEFNPIDKRKELCELLNGYNLKYEMHTSNDKDEEYNYLDGENICITVINPYIEEKLYIDLEDEGELTISFGEWHSHYYNDEEDYVNFLDDLKGIFNNEKCTCIIKSTKRWLSSRLINCDEELLYEKNIKSLPKEFQKEIESIHGFVYFNYWNNSSNKEINL